MNHPVRKNGKHFKGNADHRCTPRNRTREDVFEMVKDVKVVFVRDKAANQSRLVLSTGTKALGLKVPPYI